MEVRLSKKADLPKIKNYMLKQFPNRGESLCDRLIDFWYSNPKRNQEYFVILLNEEEICGMTLYSPMSFFFNGDKKRSCWGFDLIIDEDAQREAFGMELLLFNSQNFKNSHCTGSNPKAVKINQKLGGLVIGEIRKYVKLSSPIYSLISFFQRNINKKFPTRIKTFDLIDENVDLPSYNKPFNNAIFEPERDVDFLRWRFFGNDIHKYYVYHDRDTDDYFVTRIIKYRGIAAILLVDFRCCLTDNSFEKILEALHCIAKRLKIGVIIASSSYKTSDVILERHNYKSIGRPRPIIGPKKHYKDFLDLIKSRYFAFVTFADSDGEVYYE